jgi:hypothetical protein
MKSVLRSMHLLLGMLALGVGASAQVNVTFNGFVTYEDRVVSFNGLAAGPGPNVPARFVDIEVVDATFNVMPVVAGNRFTNANGGYALTVSAPLSSTLTVRARTTTARARTAAAVPVAATVTPNPTAAVPAPVAYALNLGTRFVNGSATFPLGAANAPATPVVFGALASPGNPFNVLDCALDAFQYINGTLAGPIAPAPVTLRFPTSFAAGSLAFFATATANIDASSGYDDAVILHEMGHIVEGLFSTPTQPGGFHIFGASDQDPRLSWSEGFASYFGASVMRNVPARYTDPGIFVDTIPGAGNVPVINTRARLEDQFPFNAAAPNWPNRTAGESDELAVASILWDIADTPLTIGTAVNDNDASHGTLGVLTVTPPFGGYVGYPTGTGERQIFAIISGAMNNPLLNGTTLATFWDAWQLSLSPSHIVALDSIGATLGVRFVTDANEPNGTAATATPVVGSTAWIPGLTFFSGPPASILPSISGLDSDNYVIQLTAGSTFLIQTRYPGAAADAETMSDARVLVIGPPGSTLFPPFSGTLADRNENSGLRTASVDGAYTITVVPDANTALLPNLPLFSPGRRYGQYELRVQTPFVNAPPTAPTVAAYPATVGQAALPVSMSAGGSTDPNGTVAGYEWILTSNGSLVSSNASFGFAPTLSADIQTFPLGARAIDNLGARSPSTAAPLRAVTTGVLFNDVQPQVNQAFDLQVAGASSGAAHFFWGEPASPSQPPGTDGTLLLNINTIQHISDGAAFGTAIVPAVNPPLSVPNIPALAGYVMHLQALYVHPTTGQWTWSTQLDLTIAP